MPLEPNGTCVTKRRPSLSKNMPFEPFQRDLPIPPYTLGLWLGDGHSAGARFTTADPEVNLDYIRAKLTLGWELFHDKKFTEVDALTVALPPKLESMHLLDDPAKVPAEDRHVLLGHFPLPVRLSEALWQIPLALAQQPLLRALRQRLQAIQRAIAANCDQRINSQLFQALRNLIQLELLLRIDIVA